MQLSVAHNDVVFQTHSLWNVFTAPTMNNGSLVATTQALLNSVQDFQRKPANSARTAGASGFSGGSD